MNAALEIPKRPARKFLPENFAVTSWDVLRPYFEDLNQRKLDSVASLKKWFHDRSEIESVISEDLAWRYIRMTCYTENKEYLNAYQDFIQNIQPQIAPVSDQLNKKAAASPHLSELASQEGYDIDQKSEKRDRDLSGGKRAAVYRD